MLHRNGTKVIIWKYEVRLKTKFLQTHQRLLVIRNLFGNFWQTFGQKNFRKYFQFKICRWKFSILLFENNQLLTLSFKLAFPTYAVIISRANSNQIIIIWYYQMQLKAYLSLLISGTHNLPYERMFNVSVFHSLKSHFILRSFHDSKFRYIFFKYGILHWNGIYKERILRNRFTDRFFLFQE